MQYDYDESMAGIYRQIFVKAFKKNIDDALFSFIIVDSVNDKTDYYHEMWSYAKEKGFEVGLKYNTTMSDENVNFSHTQKMIKISLYRFTSPSFCVILNEVLNATFTPDARRMFKGYMMDGKPRLVI